MYDPTLDEMREYLAGAGFYESAVNGALPAGSELDPDAEAALYWFAADYHGGQDSNLYAALCASPFKPGPGCRLETESESGALCYAALAVRFAS
jgi:hypothetical protein